MRLASAPLDCQHRTRTFGPRPVHRSKVSECTKREHGNDQYSPRDTKIGVHPNRYRAFSSGMRPARRHEARCGTDRRLWQQCSGIELLLWELLLCTTRQPLPLPLHRRSSSAWMSPRPLRGRDAPGAREHRLDHLARFSGRVLAVTLHPLVRRAGDVEIGGVRRG
jgi:hypothetical protein